MIQRVLVLYHKYCRDGFTSAAVAFKFYMESLKNKADKVELTFKSLDPSKLESAIDELITHYDSKTKILSLDLSFTLLAFNKLSNYFSDLTILDHHKTTKEQCINLLENPLQKELIIYDEEYCGATLAFKYFYPDQEIPEFLKYIQARDLWKETEDMKTVNAGLLEALPLKYLSEKEVNEYIQKVYVSNDPNLFVHQACCEPNVPYFVEWIQYMENDLWVKEMTTTGKIVMNLLNRAVSQTCKSAAIKKYKEYQVYLVNTDQNVSNVAAKLYEETDDTDCFPTRYKCDCVMVWRFNHSDNLVYVSLRSKQGYGIDVQKMAIELAGLGKGGGHRHAAGFECTMKRWNEIVEFFEIPPY
jgi:oligoribonuclease NrnB/cAMP/cGMP phosphodiesterase (DHH superfamily)